MLKTIFLLTLTTASILFTQPVQADTPSAPVATVWAFRQHYDTGKTVTTTDPTAKDTIPMSLGSTWTCKHTPVSKSDDGMFVGGFTCVSENHFVSAVAICSRTTADLDQASVTIGDAHGWVKLTAVCRTSSSTTPLVQSN